MPSERLFGLHHVRSSGTASLAAIPAFEREMQNAEAGNSWRQLLKMLIKSAICTKIQQSPFEACVNGLLRPLIWQESTRSGMEA
jgi:hypothetical protein